MNNFYYTEVEHSAKGGGPFSDDFLFHRVAKISSHPYNQIYQGGNYCCFHSPSSAL